MARSKRPASERVLCVCCNRMVSPNTRRNHLKGRHGGPVVQAAALTYRQQVLAAGPPELEDVRVDFRDDAIHHGGPHPGPSRTVADKNLMDVDRDEPFIGPHRQESCTEQSIVTDRLHHVEEAFRGLHLRTSGLREEGRLSGQEDDERDGESEEDEATANSSSPFMEAEDQGNDSDEAAEELDEYGLFAHERLTETFERELVDAYEDLSPQDRRILRLFALKVRTKLTRDAFAMLPFAFADDDGTPAFETSEDEISSRAAFLSGLDPKSYHSCVRSCCCYVGPYKDASICPYCSEPRLNSLGRPRKLFTYIPVIPRLKAMCKDQEMSETLRYRANYVTSPPLHVPPLPSCAAYHHRTGLGRPDACYCPSKVEDVFDSQHYRALRDTPVTIDGKTYQFNYFAGNSDIALGYLTDGFTPFKRSKQTCWPLLLVNFNLPPEVRFQSQNLICVGVIPGPHKPKDPDSFMWPMVEELLSLAAGMPTFDSHAQVMLSLRAFLILCGGDIPAVSMIMNIKGHNGFSPCRMCKILGVQVPNSAATVYYCPLDRSHHPDVLSGSRSPPQYNPRDLPLRTHAEFLEQASKVQMSATRALEERLSRQYGIKGTTILASIHSLSFPTSFPYDFMHLIYENLIPNLVLLWTGEFKGLDEGTEQYRLDGTVWEAVGKATVEAGSTIPSSYGPRVRNVKEDRAYLTADMWSFWALYLGPVLLHRKFKDQKYFTHFTELIGLLNACLSFEFSADKITTIREGFVKWVITYEKFYYQYKPERLPTCVLTIHALLHIADSIEAMGPVWAYWAFPMERYCGILQRSVRSRRFPFANLAQTVLSDARLKQLGLRFNIRQMLTLKPPPNACRRGQFTSAAYTTCILLPPRRPSNSVQDPQLTRRVQVHFATRFGKPLAVVRRCWLGARIEAFGRVMRIGGDTMWASSMIPTSEGQRDPTWIRYDALVDRNARRRNAPEDYSHGPTVFYGQLQHILVVTLPATPQLNLTNRTEYILADIHTCKSDIDGPLDSKMYDSMSTVQVFDMTCVQGLVGRVKALTAVQGGHAKDVWAILDRSERSDGAIYVPDEDNGFGNRQEGEDHVRR